MVEVDREVFIIYTTGGEKTNIYQYCQCVKLINKKKESFLFSNPSNRMLI